MLTLINIHILIHKFWYIFWRRTPWRWIKLADSKSLSLKSFFIWKERRSAKRTLLGKLFIYNKKFLLCSEGFLSIRNYIFGEKNLSSWKSKLVFFQRVTGRYCNCATLLRFLIRKCRFLNIWNCSSDRELFFAKITFYLFFGLLYFASRLLLIWNICFFCVLAYIIAAWTLLIRNVL